MWLGLLAGAGTLLRSGALELRILARRSFEDKPRNKKREKVTLAVERSILALRNGFGWGSARIQQGLQSLPKFMKKVFAQPIVQGVNLSRTTINDVLEKHGLNGYSKKSDCWKFFRAKHPNELWQLDIKGPFTVQGHKYYWVVCIDDHSRYMLVLEQLDHCPTIEEIGQILKPYIKKYHPESILTDNNPFKEEWDEWCKNNGIKPLHAHPYYPQDKGKIERGIRNVAEEFVYLIKKFPQWLNNKTREYKNWYNKQRYHRGIKTTPATLFT